MIEPSVMQILHHPAWEHADVIQTRNGYIHATLQLERLTARIQRRRAILRRHGITEREIDIRICAWESQRVALLSVIERYESRAGLAVLHDLEGFGRLVIRLHQESGLSQRQLAKRIGIDQSQLCRMEAEQFSGITLEFAGRLLKALNAEMRSTVRLAGRS